MLRRTLLFVLLLATAAIAQDTPPNIVAVPELTPAYFAGKLPDEGTIVTATIHVKYVWKDGRAIRSTDDSPWELSWITSEGRLTRNFTEHGVYFSRQKPTTIYRHSSPPPNAVYYGSTMPSWYPYYMMQGYPNPNGAFTGLYPY